MFSGLEKVTTDQLITIMGVITICISFQCLKQNIYNLSTYTYHDLLEDSSHVLYFPNHPQGLVQSGHSRHSVLGIHARPFCFSWLLCGVPVSIISPLDLNTSATSPSLSSLDTVSEALPTPALCQSWAVAGSSLENACLLGTCSAYSLL